MKERHSNSYSDANGLSWIPAWTLIGTQWVLSTFHTEKNEIPFCGHEIHLDCILVKVVNYPFLYCLILILIKLERIHKEGIHKEGIPKEGDQWDSFERVSWPGDVTSVERWVGLYKWREGGCWCLWGCWPKWDTLVRKMGSIWKEVGSTLLCNGEIFVGINRPLEPPPTTEIPKVLLLPKVGEWLPTWWSPRKKGPNDWVHGYWVRPLWDPLCDVWENRGEEPPSTYCLCTGCSQFRL